MSSPQDLGVARIGLVRVYDGPPLSIPTPSKKEPSLSAEDSTEDSTPRTVRASALEATGSTMRNPLGSAVEMGPLGFEPRTKGL